ncbi:hypothetical protein QTO34_006734 [Cnephaeus nilssonii]|uniref:Uncharacterized protein n=1 Tax=Cnephaeus nilssonii TaxID=3371016 RepID=A0AA40LGY5_CNENI|nr:hypothetical protein QTO34_006734 [Eptesicus nilssonii]
MEHKGIPNRTQNYGICWAKAEDRTRADHLWSSKNCQPEQKASDYSLQDVERERIPVVELKPTDPTTEQESMLWEELEHFCSAQPPKTDSSFQSTPFPLPRCRVSQRSVTTIRHPLGTVQNESGSRPKKNFYRKEISSPESQNSQRGMGVQAQGRILHGTPKKRTSYSHLKEILQSLSEETSQSLSEEPSQSLWEKPSQSVSEDPSQSLSEEPSQSLPEDPSQSLSEDISVRLGGAIAVLLGGAIAVPLGGAITVPLGGAITVLLGGAIAVPLEAPSHLSERSHPSSLERRCRSPSERRCRRLSARRNHSPCKRRRHSHSERSRHSPPERTRGRPSARTPSAPKEKRKRSSRRERPRHTFSKDFMSYSNIF